MVVVLCILMALVFCLVAAIEEKVGNRRGVRRTGVDRSSTGQTKDFERRTLFPGTACGRERSWRC